MTINDDSHTVSEEEGMLEMAQWLGSFTPEVPVQLIRAGEPFWVPKADR